MSESKLPEELLHRILSFHFARLPEAFCGDRGEGLPPHEQYWVDKRVPVHPTSNALLVSKRWLRIGTPLLYRFLSLSTLEHTQTVAALFRENPALRKAVRHVRLRGGYGKDLKSVLSAAPNVESLSVSLLVKSKDSITGLCKVLPTIDPSTLYIRVPVHRLTKKRAQLLSVLGAAIANQWPSLELLHFIKYSAVPSTLRAAICSSQSLRRISICGADVSTWLSSGHLKSIGENKNISAVLYRGADRWADSREETIQFHSVPPGAVSLLKQVDYPPREDWADQPMHMPGQLNLSFSDSFEENDSEPE